MSFFKDFQEDFSDAVDEMVPGNDASKEESSTGKTDGVVRHDEVNVDHEMSKLDGLLETVEKKKQEVDASSSEEPAPSAAAAAVKLAKDSYQTTENEGDTGMDSTTTAAANETAEETGYAVDPVAGQPVSDENAVITSGMTITGDLQSTGSIEVNGVINGNVSCNGKLTITGHVHGNSASSEFFADAAKIEGEVVSSGTVKIGVGSVVIGNISATSAVIAGAVKGDIDVQGPVVVDTSAVVMGNIKSRSVQINNGAVIQGFCSQEYADVDVAQVFEG